MHTTRLSHTAAAVLFLAAAVAVAGCAKKPPPLAATKAPEVVYQLPVAQTYIAYEEFTGRTEAYEAVEIRPEVTGKLVKIYFTDGKEVRTGDPLFDIDDRVFIAERDSARGAVAQARASIDQYRATVEQSKARVILADSLYGRAKISWDKQTIAREELDKAIGERDTAYAAVDQARANVKSAEAALETAQANLVKADEMLSRTKITAPFTGKLSDRRIFAGNIVKENDSILTTLVRLDKVYISFDIDERTLLRLRRLIGEGKRRSARDLAVRVGLADEDEYSLSAYMKFFDNTLDQSTGTIRVRAELTNPPPPTVLTVDAVPAAVVGTAGVAGFEWTNPDRRRDALSALAGPAAVLGSEPDPLKFLSPKMFVRVRFPVGEPRVGLLVPEEALVSSQGEKSVYVVNDADEVRDQKVTLGPQEGKLRVIESGLRPTDRVIVKGQQRVRAFAKVIPKLEGASTNK